MSQYMPMMQQKSWEVHPSWGDDARSYYEGFRTISNRCLTKAGIYAGATIGSFMLAIERSVHDMGPSGAVVFAGSICCGIEMLHNLGKSDRVESEADQYLQEGVEYYRTHQGEMPDWMSEAVKNIKTSQTI